jgi:cytochrome c-type biogenesis protein CcmE
VTFTGVLPDLFAENKSTVTLGRLENGTFAATEVLAKHDETYMPAEVAESLEAQGVDPTQEGHSYGCQGTVPGALEAKG